MAAWQSRMYRKKFSPAFFKRPQGSRGQSPRAATAVAESPRSGPSRHAPANAKRSAGRGEKTVRWTVFSWGDPRRGSPRFVEQCETNEKSFCLSHPLHPSPSQSVGVSTPSPGRSPYGERRDRGLKGRGVFPKASHKIEAREALSVRCLSNA